MRKIKGDYYFVLSNRTIVLDFSEQINYDIFIYVELMFLAGFTLGIIFKKMPPKDTQKR